MGRHEVPHGGARAGRGDVTRRVRGLRLRRVPRARRTRTRLPTGAQSPLELNARARELNTFTELRIVGPDTDLRINVGGREWLAADGKLNMPDGEIFTSPVETETEGEIRFSFPGDLPGARGGGRSAALRGRSRRPRRSRQRERVPAVSPRHGRGRAHPRRSRRSGSTTRSTASRATSSSTRRSAARCTSRSARASRSSAAGTNPVCTGT